MMAGEGLSGRTRTFTEAFAGEAWNPHRAGPPMLENGVSLGNLPALPDDGVEDIEIDED